MKNRFVFITKDAMCKCYLPVYGNKSIATPNIDELANKGTIFNRFYTVAPSTAMSAIGMFLGIYPFQTDHKKYEHVREEKNTFFDQMYNNGYDCHILWDQCDIDLTKDYSKCYGNAKFHIIDVDQVVGTHNLYKNEIKNDEDLAHETLNTIINAINEIFVEMKKNEKSFLWIHLPQVLKGRSCYGTDIDLFDSVIGCLRKLFNDDEIYISSDHGNMNGCKNKIQYGFDLYENAINIPLITPKIEGLNKCDVLLSNKDISSIFNGVIPNEKFIVSDTAYYAQPHRKLCIIFGKYKYIYNKKTDTEELYDLEFDPSEECNIISKTKYDSDRKIYTVLSQVYYYPSWEESQEALKEMKKYFATIWRKESLFEKCVEYFRLKGQILKRRIKQRRAKREHE